MHIFAYDVEPGNVDQDAELRAFLLDPTDGAVKSNIIGVKIYDANGNLVEYRTNEENGITNDGDLVGSDNSAVDISFVLDDPGGLGNDDDIYSLIVSNLLKNYTVEFVTEEGHDLALVENVSGSFDIGGFNVKNTVDVPDQDFDSRCRSPTMIMTCMAVHWWNSQSSASPLMGSRSNTAEARGPPPKSPVSERSRGRRVPAALLAPFADSALWPFTI